MKLNSEEKYFRLNRSAANLAARLHGPVFIFGAGGFIGVNLLKSLLLYRKDVYGISQDIYNNWRFSALKVPAENLINCDINDFTQLADIIREKKPATVFNLAAYGAYSKQKEYKKIYLTNFSSSVDMIELLRQQHFTAYVQAGSSSEYGINSAGPHESADLVPNCHYAVSKVAVWNAIKYYGMFEKLPVMHLRIYSAYGPWEEPDRLIPSLISAARKKKFPELVNGDISRDFIYITDVCSALIHAANLLQNKVQFGCAVNIGTSVKTTIRDLAFTVKRLCSIKNEPVFGTMPDRTWDLTEWYSDNKKAKKILKWTPEIALEEGIKNVINWQKDISFDQAIWNRTKP